MEQARFIGWSTYLAWSDPNTRMFAQFLLRDIDQRDPRRRKGTKWSEFQTGLFFADGTPKPAAQAFRMPFWAQVQDAGGQPSVLLFGGVRPADGPVVVRVERRAGEADAWHPVEVTGERCEANGPAFIADPSGWFLRTAPYAGAAEYRLSRLLPGGSWESGVSLPVAAGSALRHRR
jgi:hypothetical protein